MLKQALQDSSLRVSGLSLGGRLILQFVSCQHAEASSADTLKVGHQFMGSSLCLRQDFPNLCFPEVQLRQQQWIGMQALSNHSEQHAADH